MTAEHWPALLAGAAALLFGWMDRRAAARRESRDELRAELTRETEDNKAMRAELAGLRTALTTCQVENARLSERARLADKGGKDGE